MNTNHLCTLLTALLLTVSLHAQQNDPYDQRGVQFAAQGTDFWVCFPRTYNGFSENHSRLYVVSERDCDVTVSNPLLDYSQTVHIMRREMCGPDTNYITVPFGITRIIDTISLLWPRIYNYSYAGQPGNSPQPRGFHVTSTDTVSLFIWVNSVGESGACNVLPTEMLRDEYVVQVPFSMRRLDPGNHYPYATSLNIVAVEDSTIVDIVLSDWDWVNRHPGDTVTVTLRAGEIYHIGAGEPREKYYPLISPYGPGYKGVPSDISMPLHSYDTSHVLLDTFVVDLSGTRIKARDCKRIAVFEGGEAVFLPAIDDYYHQCDMLLEQSLPTKYSGKEYLIPNVYNSDTDYIRITGLHDGTVITIRDASRTVDAVRTLTVDAYETEWFCMMDSEGPFYITTSEPAIVKEYLMHGLPRILDIMGGDPAFYAVRPVEWWHNGQVNFGTITDVDDDNNRQTRRPSLYIFTRTEDAPSIMVDSYSIENYFTPIPGTPYCHARFGYTSQFVSDGTHYIRSTTGAKFMSVMASASMDEQAVVNLPHVQPGKAYLRVKRPHHLPVVGRAPRRQRLLGLRRRHHTRLLPSRGRLRLPAGAHLPGYREIPRHVRLHLRVRQLLHP